MDEGAQGVQPPSGTPQVPQEAGAQIDGDQDLPARVAARDRRSFAEDIFDQYAEAVYRYVLAWTADSTVAAELTAQVLRTAVTRMERLAEPGADVEARTIALARAAVARRTEARSRIQDAPPRNVGAFAASEPVPLLLAAVGRLDNAQREVLILRQLLGRSTEHAARLLAFDPPVVDELERAASATLWRQVNHAQDTRAVSAWDALTVTAALRQGARAWLPPPSQAVMAELRERLLADVDPAASPPAGSEPAGEPGAAPRRLSSSLVAFAARRRWLLAGCVASAALGTVAALTIGQAGQTSSCAQSGCVVTTTAPAAGNGGPAGSGPTEGSLILPTSTTRPSESAAFPARSSTSTQTTVASTTTTAVPGTSTPPTTRPRRTTTTTTRPTTSTTAPTTTTTNQTTTTNARSVTVRDQTVSVRPAAP
jgi:DNA-directed RNA polymerase specialized sigma24 family protein